MQTQPLPVVVLSALAGDRKGLALQAMELGAVEVLDKGQAHGLLQRLALALRRAALTKPKPVPGRGRSEGQAKPGPGHAKPPLDLDRVVAIGASTGGTGALHELLPCLPAEHPPLLIVQHMPAGFTGSLAARLDASSALNVREAVGGERLDARTALLAPGGRHLRLSQDGRTTLTDEPAVGGLRPRADLLIEDAARAYGERMLLVVLTGMGNDGLRGAREVQRRGGRILVESEDSCTVFGMPRAIVDAGLADDVLDLGRLAQAISSEARA